MDFFDFAQVNWKEVAPWLAIIAYIFITRWDDIKNGIFRMYSDRAKHINNELETEKTLAETEFEFMAQAKATREAREWSFGQEALDLMRRQFSLYEKDFKEMNKAIQELARYQLTTTHELEGIKTSLRQLWGTTGKMIEELEGINSADDTK